MLLEVTQYTANNHFKKRMHRHSTNQLGLIAFVGSVVGDSDGEGEAIVVGSNVGGGDKIVSVVMISMGSFVGFDVGDSL